MLDIPKLRINDVVEVEGHQFRLVVFAHPTGHLARIQFISLAEELDTQRKLRRKDKK